MIKRIVLCALVCVMVSVTAALAQPTATEAWNDLAGTYHFVGYPASAGTTFKQGYYGDNFDADFAAIKNALGKALSAPPVNVGNDDTINIELEAL